MASHYLIDKHLAELTSRLPAGAVDELADGLHETWQCHLDRGLPMVEAAHAAIAEFGTPTQIADAFVAQAAGRCIARTLLTTGPIVGACWAIGLIAAHAWTWPIPTMATAGLAAALLTVVACLVAAATSRHSYRRTRLGDLGAAGLIALDLVVVTAATLAAPALTWPLMIAVTASLTRVAKTVQLGPSLRLPK